MNIAMDPRQQNAGMTGGWRLLTTPPLSGQANMDVDRHTLRSIEQGGPAVLRFFRFDEPTVTYGRLQPPPNPRAVQRPTGGGIVFHHEDLCISLCWPNGLAPLPEKPTEQYRWIHGQLMESLTPIIRLRMADCCDVPVSSVSFGERECFREPVGYDLMEGTRKRLGGALYRTRHATLYQGSIQWPLSAADEQRLKTHLLCALTA